MKKTNIKALVSATLSSAVITVMTLPVFAAGEIDTEKVNSGIQGIGDFLAKFAPSIFLVVLTIVGLACMLGSSSREWGKKMAMWSFLGFLITLFASPIVSSIQSFFA